MKSKPANDVMPARLWILTAMLAAFAAAFLALSTTAPAQAQTPNTILILDSSRSMWGHIDKVNKVVIARDVLGKLFKEYDGKMSLGLMAYGHQKESGCDDFGVLKKVGPLDADAYTSAVRSISPKGSTPIARTITAAAEVLVKRSGPVNIVLISDGMDNCRGDPCGLAKQLAAMSSRMKIHTIAFDRKNKQALEGLACISEPSGGVFASATSKVELEDALERVFASITKPPRQEVRAAATPRPGIAPNTPAKLTLTAYLGSLGQEISRGVIWRIFAGQAEADGRYRLLKEDRSAQPAIVLKPGTYHVHASYGLAHTTKRIDLSPGQDIHEQVIINAGGLRLQAVQAEGQRLPDKAVRFDVYSEETDQFGNRRRLVSNAPIGPVIRLNSGTYQVVSTYGNSNSVVEAEVEIKPGKLTEAVIVHKAAKVTFKLVRRPGGEAMADTRWRIMTENGEVVKESAGAFPSHILAQGAYKVTAEQGGRTYVQNFTVGSSGSQQVEVLMR